ncbi:MAG TPA: acyl-CoA synthetase, partial [Burkholderiales bacterium]|nr:acyl-CoA synthetase [Burkholderiales bacterium]
MGSTAHTDTFARDNLPPRAQWPELIFDLPELRYPGRLNCATELLDRAPERGWARRVALRFAEGELSYAQLLEQSNRIARVLAEDMGVATGNRVLLRGANSPWMAACWFAVMKAGGIAVATMPLLRAKELTEIILKARVTHALCDRRLDAELKAALPACPILKTAAYWGDDAPDSLETLAARKPGSFTNVDTAAEDVALIAFTSGTTGKPKGIVHSTAGYILQTSMTMKWVFDLREEDTYWCTADIGWVTGHSYIVYGPLAAGATS